MSFDYKRDTQKKEELISTLQEFLSRRVDESNAQMLAKQVFTEFVSTTSPEEGEVYIELVTAASFSGRGGGRSSKLGNIRLNIRLLFEAISAGTFTVISVAEAPWAIPFAAIMLWNSVWKAAQVELTEKEVAILWTMWRIRGTDKHVKQSDLLPAVNEHMTTHCLPTMSESDLNHGLTKLQRIESIEKSKRRAGEWRLIEWIQKSYE